MKKIVALLLVSVLCVGLLCGCGQSSEPEKAEDARRLPEPKPRPPQKILPLRPCV